MDQDCSFIFMGTKTGRLPVYSHGPEPSSSASLLDEWIMAVPHPTTNSVLLFGKTTFQERNSVLIMDFSAARAQLEGKRPDNQLFSDCLASRKEKHLNFSLNSSCPQQTIIQIKFPLKGLLIQMRQ